MFRLRVEKYRRIQNRDGMLKQPHQHIFLLISSCKTNLLLLPTLASVQEEELLLKFVSLKLLNYYLANPFLTQLEKNICTVTVFENSIPV